MATVGKIVQQTPNGGRWIIADFLSVVHSHDTSKRLISPLFDFHNKTLYFSLNFDPRKNEMGLSIWSKSEIPEIQVSLSMRSGPNGKKETRSGILRYNFLVKIWLTCSEMRERRAEILHPDGSLAVFFDLHLLTEDASPLAAAPLQLADQQNVESNDNEASLGESGDEEEAIPQQKSMTKMQEDMRNLLTSNEDSDVTLKVKEKEFRAHRAILKARSAVFKSMFSHDTAENQSGEVTIEDCDPASFPDFLTYVYTGSSEHIGSANVCGLYTAADKYCVDALKEDCLFFMKNNLSVDLFCDVIALALRHGEEELVELATKFFCDHMLDIIKTIKWQRFLPENSTVANELMIKAVSK